MNTSQNTFWSVVWEYVRVIVTALILAGLIRSFVVEPYKIPSASMVPTLLVGDYLYVSKYAYGLRVPFTDTFFFEKDPARGDVAVFKKDDTGLAGSFFGLGDTYLIKRVVAVPGDTVAYVNKTLYINGEALELEPKGEYTYFTGRGERVTASRFEEQLVDISHDVLFIPGRPSRDVAPMVVPEGMYVMMGDNRDDSRDAREWNHPNWGFVPREDFMGRAEFIFWSWDRNYKPRFNRIFDSLKAGHTPT